MISNEEIERALKVKSRLDRYRTFIKDKRNIRAAEIMPAFLCLKLKKYNGMLWWKSCPECGNKKIECTSHHINDSYEYRYWTCHCGYEYMSRHCIPD